MQEKYIIQNIINGLSKDRLVKYLESANHDIDSAFSLYEHNTRVSESFYTPIQGLEILLRNKIHQSLSKDFGEKWILSNSIKLEYFHQESVSKANQKSKILLTIPKLIAEMNLGFWTALFGRKYEELWRQNLRYVFKNSPAPLLRKDILNKLNSIRELRNRIAHHEPICNRNLYEDHQNILNLINLMCNDTYKWIKKESRFEKIIMKKY